MTKEEWKQVEEVRIFVSETDENGTHFSWSFPIKCPRWVFKLLMKLEI